MRKIYNKLIRDKLPEIYKQDIEEGISMEAYSIRALSNEETVFLLKEKLQEEVNEVFESYESEDVHKLKEELADVIEVIRGIAFHNQTSFEEIITLADAKKEKKGGFEHGFYLESIDYLETPSQQ